MSKDRMTLTRTIVVSMLIAATGAAYAIDGDSLGYTLLIQQSPADGGAVTPGTGVHKVGVGQTVTLSAVPRPGYQFLYWLGDVSASTTTDTSINVDSPKMVVAVFGPASFEEDELLGGGGIGMSTSSRSAMGGLRSSPYPITGSSGVSPASRGNQILNPVVMPPDGYDDFNGTAPVPGDENVGSIPVPGNPSLPEPATCLLLSLGGVFLLRQRK